VIEIRDVTLAYEQRPVLFRFSLTVPAGTAVAVRGPNGSGKSTLLRAAAGLLPPRAGIITVDGEPVDETRPEFRRAVVSLLDDGAWYPSLTVIEHVELVRLAAGRPAAPRWAPDELVDRLELRHMAGESPLRLSSGQRQRLALAMTFARASSVMLLDEPERHLDSDGRATVVDLIRRYVADGGTVLVATHEPVLTAAFRTVDLTDGP
jgi:ABC-type multidrug transport system ATPase subunit